MFWLLVYWYPVLVDLERGGEGEGESERERERECVCVCGYVTE